MNFSFYVPTKVVFGNLSPEVFRKSVFQYGRNVMVISGGISTTSIAISLTRTLAHECTVTLVHGVQSNPLSTFIENVAYSYHKPDVIISVGGGSVHDTAKALSVLFTHEGRIEQFLTDGEYGVSGITERTIPVITVPTIFGTGAELSPAALLRIYQKKRVLFSPFLYPKITFIDPSFSVSLPLSTCKYSALDAFVQGIESYVSKKSQDFSRMFSLSSITRVLKALLDVEQNGITRNNMEQMALASIESMYAVCQSSVGAVHAISDPLSGIYDIHHGKAVGLLLPYVVQANYPYAATAYDELASLINSVLLISGTSIHESIRTFYKAINFQLDLEKDSLVKMGILDDLEKCVSDSFNGDMDGNPFEMNTSDIYSILTTLVE